MSDCPITGCLVINQFHRNHCNMTSTSVLNTASFSMEDKAILWVFGVLERLANLGYLENPPYHICPDRIDLFEEFDSYCQCLFESEAEFEDLLERICQSVALVDEEQIEVVTQLVRDYRDNRVQLAKFALDTKFAS